MLIEEPKDEQLHKSTCLCSACRFIPKRYTTIEDSDLQKPNCMHKLLKILPFNFHICLEQTVVVEQNQSSKTEFHCFCNQARDERQKWNMLRYQLKTLNQMNTHNVHLYFHNTQKIIPKYEALNVFSSFKSQRIQLDTQVLYIQPYQPAPIIRTQYNHKKPMKDALLQEYVGKEADKFRNKNYKINEELLEWVFRQYGEDTFCQFLAHIYARYFRALTQNTIRSVIFYWILQPLDSIYSSPGHRYKAEYDKLSSMGKPRSLAFRPKLVNAKQLDVQFYQKYYSFQQQFEDKIKEKIYSREKKTISAVKNKGYRVRLDNFRNKLHSTYQQEQKSVLNKVQEEKKFQFEHDTQQMAKMLIPNMTPFRSLRQVINSEAAFRKVFGKPTIPRLKTEQKQSTQKSKRDLTMLTPMKRLKTEKQLRESKYELLYETIRKKHDKLLKTPSTSDFKY